MALGTAQGAAAHVVATVSVASPREGARVASAVNVIVTADAGGTQSADFQVLLDDQPVGRDGTVGAKATFTSLSLKAGGRLTIGLHGLANGKHTLTVRYAADKGHQKRDVVRRFSVGGTTDRLRVIGIGVVVALLLAAAFVARRNAFRQR